MKHFFSLLMLSLILISGCDLLNQDTIVGNWTRSGGSGRTYTEQLIFNEDSSYTVEARYDDDNSLVASNFGTYSFDESKIYYVQSDSSTKEEIYQLRDSGQTLVIENDNLNPWTRF
jgi:hypothetical protein